MLTKREGDTATPSQCAGKPNVNKRGYGEAIRPTGATVQGFHAEHVKLVTVNPGQAEVSSTGMLLMAGKQPCSRDCLREFDKRGERWLVVQTTYL